MYLAVLELLGNFEVLLVVLQRLVKLANVEACIAQLVADRTQHLRMNISIRRK